MPIYIYRAEDGREVEMYFSFADDLPDVVELDDGTPARRVVAWKGGHRLRGKGWARHPERDTANRKWGPQYD